jgi:FMN hydrolase / 5-amino-6-(5-phospho-D-ribitylamino)uracil phosphatase
MRVKKVVALSLDLDDTLWPFAPAVENAERALHRWLLQHVPATSAVLDGPQTLKKSRKEIEFKRPDLLGDPGALRLESIREILAKAGGDPLLAKAAYDVFYAQRQRVELFADVMPALKRLSRHYPIIAVTNGNSDLGAAGLRSFFRTTIAASKYGCAKPDALIFRAAAEFLGVEAERLLHVGDDWLLDVVGAKSAGLQAAWLRRGGPLGVPVSPRPGSTPDLVVRDLLELCEILCPD